MTAPATPPDVPEARDAAESLSFTVQDVPPPERDLAAAQNRRGRLTMLAILAVCAAPVVLSYLLYYVVRPQLHTVNYATLIDPQRTLPDDLPLRTLEGKPVAAASLRHQWLLVVVAPAACDAACEQRLYLQRQLREMLGAERDRVDKVWLVVDEASAVSDAPVPRAALLSAITAAPATLVLRVDRAALGRWLAPEPGHALEEHVYLVDPMGNWMMRAPVDPDPKKFKGDLDRLLKASASWDTPGRP
jgi:hypothetical protein